MPFGYIISMECADAVIDPDNIRSIRVAEKLGATLRDQIEFRGNPVNIYAVPPLRG